MQVEGQSQCHRVPFDLVEAPFDSGECRNVSEKVFRPPGYACAYPTAVMRIDEECSLIQDLFLNPREESTVIHSLSTRTVAKHMLGDGQ